MKRAIFLLLALSINLGPFALAELTGGRSALSALTGGEPGDIVRAMTFVASWVWAVFTSVPALVGALVLGAPR